MADTRRVHRISKLKSETNDYSDSYSSKSSTIKPLSKSSQISSAVISASSKHSRRPDLMEELGISTTTKKRQVLIGRLSRSNSRSPGPIISSLSTHRTRSRNKSISTSPSRSRTVLKTTLSPYRYNNSTSNNISSSNVRNRTTLIIRTPRSPSPRSPRSRTPQPTRSSAKDQKSWSKSRSRSRSRSKGKEDLTLKSNKSKSKSKKSKSDEKSTSKDKDKEKEKSASTKDKSSSSLTKEKEKDKDKDKERSTKDKDSKKKATTPTKSSSSSKLSSSQKDQHKTNSSSSMLKSSSSKSNKGAARSPSPKNKSSSSYIKSSVSSASSKLANKKSDLSFSDSKKKKKSLSRSPRSGSEKNFNDDNYYNNRSRGSSLANQSRSHSRTRSRTRSRSSSNEHAGGYSYGSSSRSLPKSSKYPSNNGRRLTPPGYGSKRPLPGRPRPAYPASEDADLSGDDKHYESGHPPPMYSRYGGRPYLGGRGGYNDANMIPPGAYGMGNSNRNQFYPPMPPHMAPYNMQHNPKYLGKFPKKYYPMGPQMDHYGGSGGGPDGNYEGAPPPYHFMPNPRFNYRNQFNQYNPHYNSGNQAHYPPHSMNMKQQMAGAPNAYPPNSKMNKLNESEPSTAVESADIAATATSTSPNSAAAAAIVIDPELDNAVQEITTAIANATAAGKELTLTAEQQAILQKHQQLVHQQQVQQQNQLNSLQNPLLAKKQFPNYRLLGRNIFEPNKNTFIQKKRIKQNTYYSRFIKQHPTNNLPLAFQKSVSLAEDKALEEKENQHQIGAVKKSKKKRSKRSKKKKNTDDSSNSSESDSSSRSNSSSRSRSSRSSSQKSNSSSSSSSSTSSSAHGSDMSSSDGEIKKSSSNADNSLESKKKLKNKKLVKPSIAGDVAQLLVDEALNELPLNGEEAVKKQRDHSASSNSSKSSALSSSSGEIKPTAVISTTNDKKAKKTKKAKNKKTKSGKHGKSKSLLFNDSHQTGNNNTNANFDSDGSMLDLKENLRPIGAYIKDRERMLFEMFRCIKGSKLQAMLPDLLKNKPLKEIKSRCLDQLDIMSKKRIRCLLDDKPMTSSSGTDDSSDDSDSSFTQIAPNVKGNMSQENLGNTMNSSIDDKKKTKTGKGNAASKFKPIGFSEVNKSTEPKFNYSARHDENEEEDDDNNSQENDSNENLNQSETASSVNAQSGNQQQQSGIAAAGFKKFVKKSISIKIKTNEPSATGEMNEKDDKTEKDRANNLLVQKHHISKINKVKLSSFPTNPAKRLDEDTPNDTHDSDANKTIPQMPTQHLSEAEKLRAQYSQYNKAQQQLNPKLIGNQPYPPALHQGLLPTPTSGPAGMHRYMNPPPGPITTMPTGPYVPPPSSFSVPPPSINPRFHLQQPPPGVMPSVNGPPPGVAGSHLLPLPGSIHHPHHGQAGSLNNPNANYMHPMIQQHQLQNNQLPYNSYPYHQQQQQPPSHMSIYQQQQLVHNSLQQQSLQNNNNKSNKPPYMHDDYEDDINVNVNDDAAYDLDDYYNENNGLSDDQEDFKNKSSNNVDYDYSYDLELENLNDLISSNNINHKKQSNRSHRHHRSHRATRDESDDEETESIILELKSKSKRRKQSSKSKSKRNKRKHTNSDDEEDEEEEEQEVTEEKENTEPDIEALKDMLINVLRAQIEDDESEVDEDIKLTLNALLSQVQEDDGSLSYEDLSNIHLKITELLTPGEPSDQEESKAKRKKKRSKPRSLSRNDIDSELEDRKSSAPNKKKRKFPQEDSKKDPKGSKKKHNQNSNNKDYSNAEVEAGEIDDVYDDQYVVEEEFQDLLMNKRK